MDKKQLLFQLNNLRALIKSHIDDCNLRFHKLESEKEAYRDCLDNIDHILDKCKEDD